MTGAYVAAIANGDAATGVVKANVAIDDTSLANLHGASTNGSQC